MAFFQGKVISVRGVKIGNKIKVVDDDIEAFARYKLGVEEDSVVEIVFRPVDESASSRAMRLFHAIRDRYADYMGYDRDYAKDELMCRFGISLPIDRAHEAEWDGRVIQIWSKYLFRKSISSYKKSEIHSLIEGAEIACFENGIPISDLKQEYGYDGRVPGDAAKTVHQG